MTKIIGLIGGIGSGKSTVARMLRKFGAAVIDTDTLGHRIYKPGSDALSEIIRVFGRQLLTKTGEVDRIMLGNLVFQDKAALEKLNAITHPRILEKVNKAIGRYQRRRAPVVVVEAPLLIEAGWKDEVDEVWLITTLAQNVHERLKKRRGLNEKEISDRIASRYSETVLLEHADVVITNDGNREHLKKQVEAQWTRLVHEQDKHH